MAVSPRTVLEQNRDFFDQFFTKIVRNRFKIASDESPARKMSILVGLCTQARCCLSANGHKLIFMAADMASKAPEIQVSFEPAPKSNLKANKIALLYQPPQGWLDEDLKPVGNLSIWLDLTIGQFLEWAATPQ